MVQAHASLVEKDAFLRQPLDGGARARAQHDVLARNMAVGAVPLGGAGRRQQGVRAVARRGVDGQPVAAHHAAGRMDDDGMADGVAFRIQRLLHAQGAAVRAFDEAADAVVQRKAQAQLRLPGAVGAGWCRHDWMAAVWHAGQSRK